MRIDWPLIGATTGLAASVALLGTVAIVVLRNGPDEVRKAPPSPVLLSSRRTDAVASPELTAASSDLQVFSGPGRLAAQAPLVPPAAIYELFPESSDASAPPTAGSPPAATEQPAPRRPRTEPTVAKPIVAKPPPEPKKVTMLPHAAATPAAVAPKPQVRPEPPAGPPKIVDHRYDGVLTIAEIVRLKAGLRLTPDQEPLWRPVEVELRRVGKMQMALIEQGQKPDVPPSALEPIYRVAMPLFQTLRPDQKERVRIQARKMGYGSVASMI